MLLEVSNLKKGIKFKIGLKYGKWIKKLNAHLIQFFREYPTQAKGEWRRVMRSKRTQGTVLRGLDGF